MLDGVKNVLPQVVDPGRRRGPQFSGSPQRADDEPPLTGMETQPRTTIYVCMSCVGRPGARRPGPALLRALRGALAADAALAGVVDLRGIDCMSGCTRPCALAIRGEGKASYLFGDIEPQRDVADILATARAFHAAGDGWITDGHLCGRLRYCAIARIPPPPKPRPPRSRRGL